MKDYARQFKKKAISTLTSPNLLRLMSGYVYTHFGVLKFFPDLSPAEMIAEQTIVKLSFSLLNPHQALFLLACLEVSIGLCLLFKFKLKRIFPFFIFHLCMTFSPLFIYPELCFKFAPFAPTFQGQYILKNLALFAAVWVVLHPMAFGKPEEEKESENVHELTNSSQEELKKSA